MGSQQHVRATAIDPDWYRSRGAHGESHGTFDRNRAEWRNVEGTFVVVSLKIQDSLRASAKNMPSEQAQWRRTSYDE